MPPAASAQPVDARGRGGNVVAALVSFVVPGLGQLFQGRIVAALAWFFGVFVAWGLALSFAGHDAPGLGLLVLFGAYLACVHNAATWAPPLP